MTTRRFLLLLITGFLSVLFACSSDTGGPVIRGQLGHAPNTTLLFQRIGESGEVTLDSVTTDADGKFSFRNPVTELDYYILRANPTNLLFLILKGGETVEINGDAQRLDETYSVKVPRIRRASGNCGSTNASSPTHSIRSTRRRAMKILLERFRGLEIAGRLFPQHGAFRAGFHPAAQQFDRLAIGNEIPQPAAIPALMSELEENLRKAYPDNKYARDFPPSYRIFANSRPAAWRRKSNFRNRRSSPLHFLPFAGKWCWLISGQAGASRAGWKTPTWCAFIKVPGRQV